MSERSQIERSLRESEEFFRLISESTTDMIAVIDQDGRRLYNSPSYRNVLGDPEQLLGTTSFTEIHPEDQARVRRIFEETIATGVGRRTTYRFLLPDGTIRHIESEGSVIRDEQGRPAKVLVVSRDVTERHRLEEALREREEFFRLIADSMHDMIAVVDGEGRRLYNSPSYRDVLGDPNHLVGSNSFEEIHPEDRDRVRRIFQTTLATGAGQRAEYRFLLSDGTIRYVESQGSVIRDDAGQPAKVVVVSRDITEHRSAQEVRRINEALQKEVQERQRAEAELERHVKELAQSNAELQQFASVASHDLQEPLRKVQAFGERLKARCGAALDEKGCDYLGRMQAAAERMSILIEDLLAFSRVSSRAQPFARVNLNTVVQEVLSDLETRVESSSGRVEVGDLPVLEADPTQMRQLLQNLISNALKFRQPDRPAVVQVRAGAAEDTPPGTCRVLVKDHGIGFDEKYTGRIFTIFQRLHGRHEYEGTGIGLAICRKIVERHHGSIMARSAPGQGATFVVTLPLTQRERAST